MAMNLAKETFSTERKYFEAGTDIRVTTAVKPAAAALEAHAPVILGDDGKVKAVTSADLTKLSGLYGITADSVEATGSFAGMVAWANAYELKPSANNTALRVVYSNIPNAWTGIGGTIGIGTNDTVTLKIANGVARDAYLKIDVGYTVGDALTTTVTECTYTDGGEISGNGKDGFAIPANTTVTVTIKVTNTVEHPVTNMNILIDSLDGFGGCDYTTAYGNLLFSDMTFSSSTAA